ncbi:MAG: hypothetical protein ABI665_11490 [Vicinamibacterales bacterium]
MAEQDDSTVRLVAIDGSRGSDVAAAAEALAAEVREHGASCVISRWDASGLFGEMAQAEVQQRQVSARNLTLVFAADLVFRLRWEIRPALAAGHVVIAAPYVDTAVALARACGLPEGWLREVLRFAPPATIRGWSRERKTDRAWKRRLDRGYPEYCAAMLAAADPRFRAKRTRRAMVEFLQDVKGPKPMDLSKRGLEQAARRIAATGNPPASPSPVASRPRTARK